MGAGLKPLTTVEVRLEIEKLPIEHRAIVRVIAFSSYDFGISAGLAAMPRASNPFEPAQVAAQKPAGKAR